MAPDSLEPTLFGVWLVEDHCDALIHVLEEGRPGETYNIGANEERENTEVVGLLCEIMDKRLEGLGSSKSRKFIGFVKDRPGNDRRSARDSTKIRRELGWFLKHTFGEAIVMTVDWYLNHLNWVNSLRSGEYLRWLEMNYDKRGTATGKGG